MPGSNNYSQRPEEETTQQVNNPPTVQAPPAKEPVSNYESVYNILQQKIAENPLETPDQRKRRERREKLEGIISSISDAASAVSNLVFTSDYAPDMYSQSNSMSDATQRRFDKAKELRDQRLKNHLNYAMNIGRIKDAERNWRRQLEQDRIAAAQRKHDNDIADAKELRADAIFQLQQDLEKHKINAAEADARRKKIEADYAENYEKARVAREKASAGASNARADYYRGGGSGGGKDRYDSEFYDIQTERLFDMLTEKEKEAAKTVGWDFNKGRLVTTYDKKGAIGQRAQRDPDYAKKVKTAYSRQNPDGGENPREIVGSLLPGDKKEKKGSMLP